MLFFSVKILKFSQISHTLDTEFFFFKCGFCAVVFTNEMNKKGEIKVQ